MLSDARETGCGQGLFVAGQMSGAKAGKQPEGQVEGAYQQSGRQPERTDGNAEVGDEPKGIGPGVARKTADEHVEFRLGEAVEEEVSGDEVGLGLWRVFESALVVGAQARRGDGFAATAEQPEHRGAGVHGVGLDLRIGPKQGGEEATIPVAEHQGVSPVEQARKEVGADALKSRAEGKVFEQAVRAGDAIEVCGHRESRAATPSLRQK